MPPGQPAVVFATEGEGEIVGASWLVPPYRWRFDARAVELTRAIGIDAECLRDKCEADHDLGYEMMKRFLPVIVAAARRHPAADSSTSMGSDAQATERVSRRRSRSCRSRIASTGRGASWPTS